jgi:hypothetical protein
MENLSNNFLFVLPTLLRDLQMVLQPKIYFQQIFAGADCDARPTDRGDVLLLMFLSDMKVIYE